VQRFAQPFFSNLFIFLTVTLLGLLSLFLFRASGGLFLSLAFALWALDLLISKWPYRWRAIPFDTGRARFAVYIGVRAVAFVESILLVGSKNWWPTRHDK